MRYCQFVVGPAGAGKSSYCATIARHCQVLQRSVHVMNLDPAAEHFDYDISWDIRDVVSVDDVTSSLGFGPNGGLIYCMEFLMQNLEVLDDVLGQYEDDYIIFDCPGQIELYTHIPVMKQLVDHVQQLDYRVAAVYLLDAQFVDDPGKFFSGVLSALSTMLNLEIPHVNVLSKMDLILDSHRKRELENYMDPDPRYIQDLLDHRSTPRQRRLNAAIASLIEDYSLVRFLPMDREDDDTVSLVLQQVDHCMQFGEDEEVKINDEDAGDDQGAGGDGGGDSIDSMLSGLGVT